VRSARAIFILQCAITVGATATAADRDGNYAVWGPGAKSCHSYNQAAGEAARVPFSNYVMGYLTAYNAVSEETYAISGNMNLEAVMGWLDDYCGQKPMHSFEQALIDFTSSHVEHRFSRPPGSSGR
jgi:hypothetical protein